AGDGTPKIFGDGRQTRDYVFVGDVVSATLAAVDHPGGVLNVGTGRETSVVELYDAISRVSGVEREPELAPARLGELQRSFLDASLAERELGWRARHTLDDGLRPRWDWMSAGAEARAGPSRAGHSSASASRTGSARRSRCSGCRCGRGSLPSTPTRRAR